MSVRNRFALFVALTLGVAAATTDLRAADPDKTVTAAYVTAARRSVDKASALVENLQDDVVEELAAEKEKSLFRAADQTLNELDLLDKALTDTALTRDGLYKQFDRVDLKVAALVKAVSDLSPKRAALAREAERVRLQTDGLHFLLSAGDESKERQRQVLMRQARSMRSAAKQFATAADYAILAQPGRAPFLDAAKKFAEQCEAFEKSAAASDPGECKKDFSTLTEGWGLVVAGFQKLSPKEDYHIARQGFRVDEYHRRLFELLKMPGKRPVLTIKL